MNEARGAVNVWRGDKFFWWGDNFSGKGITSLGGVIISRGSLSLLRHESYRPFSSLGQYWARYKILIGRTLAGER